MRQLLLLALLAQPLIAQPPTVKILSLNVWLDCRDGYDNVAELIRRSGADLVGLQECTTSTPLLAEKLGFYWTQQREGTALLSRFPVHSTTSNRHGIIVRLESGQKLAVFNLHLNHIPYQPYQLLNIPYGDHPFIHSEQEAQEYARKARGQEIEAVLQELRELPEELPALLTGDFNEPSHLDWTDRAAEIGRHPLRVEWPTSRSLEEAGFSDAYRTLFESEIEHPGYTWTPGTKADDPKDHHDRLDFVWFRGPLEPVSATIVGEETLTPYPTDHRGMLAELKLRPNE